MARPRTGVPWPSGTSRILPNTVFRAAADVGSKLISVGFYVVIARKLGDRPSALSPSASPSARS